MFIFTGKSGEQFGYDDGWQDDETFLYTGEGQVGDMEFTRGNRAIRDHAKDGKDILLFEMLGKSQPYRFLGEFACAGWQVDRGPDKNGDMREAIRFHLVRVGLEVGTSSDEDEKAPTKSLEELRKRAYDAVEPKKAASIMDAKVRLRKRSEAVKAYVLARAGGKCELTGKPAPFLRKSGEPYLEVHHTRRLSDDGPDDPRWVAAIDPTVHRQIHLGVDGDELNKRLKEKLKAIEL
ncbi:HNH endonuclease [Tropicimonas sp. IMCC6043]|uniref:HNH endonuclease n=1 Tax=Tropicimonas sp. IMCC6043 TaxID=2510645 RepID=UPI00101B9395|nr:HNH endonuclease [Tropicimonas sp. IMCC6043]RYH07777.1 HNH endonuclease [Tropicimonas sp. IMCC6043]